LAKSKVVQSPAEVTNHQEHVGGAGTVAAAGTELVTIGLTMTTATTLDQYRGGFITFNKVTGLGQIYPIIGNTASITPDIDLGETIVTAGDTTTEFTLTPNIFNGVIILPTTLSLHLLPGWNFTLQLICIVLSNVEHSAIGGRPTDKGGEAMGRGRCQC